MSELIEQFLWENPRGRKPQFAFPPFKGSQRQCTNDFCRLSRFIIQFNKEPAKLLFPMQILATKGVHLRPPLFQSLQQGESSWPGSVTTVVLGVPGFNALG